MSDVVYLGKPHHFSVEGEIAKRIHALLMEYEGQISVVSAVGILEVVKHELMVNNGSNA